MAAAQCKQEVFFVLKKKVAFAAGTEGFLSIFLIILIEDGKLKMNGEVKLRPREKVGER